MHYINRFLLIAIALISVAFLSSCDNDKTKHLLIACSDSAEPFAYMDADGELTGFEIELVKAIAADQGFQVKFSPMEFGEIMRQFDKFIPKFDGAISLITWTTERWEGMEFTHPYFRSAVAAAVKKGVTGISSMDDLKGKKVVCKSGTTIHEYAEFLKDSIGFTVTPYKKVDDAFAAVTSGQADVVLEEYPLIHYRIYTKGADLDLAFKGDTQFTFNMAVNKSENFSLIRMFNDGLLNIEKNGTYESILKKYFPDYPDHI
jgi:polar amino acid transport system substrate-binding protein